MDFILDSRTPENLPWESSYYDGLQNNWQKLAFWASCLQHALSLGQKDMVWVSVSDYYISQEQVIHVVESWNRAEWI